MKKSFRFAGLSGALFAASLALGMNLPAAFAAETPVKEEASVTLNGAPVGIHAEMIGGKLYFSIRDYWEKIYFGPDARVTWEPETQTASGSNGYSTYSLSLQAQTCQNWDNKIAPLDGHAVLKDGRVLVTFSSLSDFYDLKIFGTGGIVPQFTENGLDFRTTIWERWEGDGISHFSPLLPESISIDPETGLPDWAHTKLSPFNGRFGPLPVKWDKFEVTKSEAEDGTLIFRYVSKENPKDFLIVTARDGYVIKLEEHNAVFPIHVCG